MELQGKLHIVLPSVSGQSTKGTWKKQEFVLETIEERPRKVAMEAWGDDCRQFDDLKPGNIIKVNFNVESREFDGRWYTTCRSWKIQVIGK